MKPGARMCAGFFSYKVRRAPIHSPIDPDPWLCPAFARSPLRGYLVAPMRTSVTYISRFFVVQQSVTYRSQESSLSL